MDDGQRRRDYQSTRTRSRDTSARECMPTATRHPAPLRHRHEPEASTTNAFSSTIAHETWATVQGQKSSSRDLDEYQMRLKTLDFRYDTEWEKETVRHYALKLHVEMRELGSYLSGQDSEIVTAAIDQYRRDCSNWYDELERYDEMVTTFNTFRASAQNSPTERRRERGSGHEVARVATTNDYYPPFRRLP